MPSTRVDAWFSRPEISRASLITLSMSSARGLSLPVNFDMSAAAASALALAFSRLASA
jgi:hypothetical protein